MQRGEQRPHTSAQFEHTNLAQNQAYAQYMRMHKVFVGNSGARQLEDIYSRLQSEEVPHYLSAAGWALAESALVRTAVEAGETKQDPEFGFMHRIALDMAVMPLLRGVVDGNVTDQACRQSLRDCLAIARRNMLALETATASGNNPAISAHFGVGYECNAPLAFNRTLSPTWFAIPAMARSDSGYYYRKQPHDLLVIHQKFGTIHSATPVEIKI